MCTGVLPEYISAHLLSGWCWRRPEEGMEPEESMDPLELELQVVWFAKWVLGIQPKSFGKITSSLNHWAISPAPIYFIITCIYLCLLVGMCSWVQLPQRSEKGTGSSGAGVTSSCQPLAWVLGSKLRSSARTSVNRWANSSASLLDIFNRIAGPTDIRIILHGYYFTDGL